MRWKLRRTSGEFRGTAGGNAYRKDCPECSRPDTSYFCMISGTKSQIFQRIHSSLNFFRILLLYSYTCLGDSFRSFEMPGHPNSTPYFCHCRIKHTLLLVSISILSFLSETMYSKTYSWVKKMYSLVNSVGKWMPPSLGKIKNDLYQDNTSLTK